jgi:predicted ribosomally synthesized peptide with SipW-like signal peptide
MSNKKFKAANVRSSILILLLIAILLIASTYAWFTANKTVTISTLNVNVQSANGLQISCDGQSWKAVLDNNDIAPNTGRVETNYSSNTNQIPTELNPVSTIAAANANGKLNMYLGTVIGDADTTSPTYGQDVLTTALETEAKGTSGNFVAFDIFLKVDRDTDIKLTSASDVTSADATDRGLKNASRVAFVVAADADVKAAGAALSDIQAVKPSVVYIWEPNSNVHTDAAVSHGISNYGFTSSTLNNSTVLSSYKGVKGVGTKVILNSSDTNVFGEVTPAYQTLENNAVDTDVFSLKQGITKVRVYLWVEGQDIDCENTASGAGLNFDIQLEADI